MGTPVGFTLLRTSVNAWATTLGFPTLPFTGPLDADLLARTQQIASLIWNSRPDWLGKYTLKKVVDGDRAYVEQYPELVAQDIDKARLQPGVLLPAPPKDPGKKSSLVWLAVAGAAAYYFLMTKKGGRR